MEKEYILQQLTMDRVYKNLMEIVEGYNDEKYVFKILLPDEDEENQDMYNLSALKDSIPECYKFLKESSNEPNTIHSISELIEFKNRVKSMKKLMEIKIYLILLGLDVKLSLHELSDDALECILKQIHKQLKDLKEEEEKRAPPLPKYLPNGEKL